MNQPLRCYPWLATTSLILLALLAYWPVRHGGMIWDDATTILGDPRIRAADGLPAFWTSARVDDYWPLHYSLLWTEWHLWAKDTLGYHLVSFMLHGLVGVCLWLLLTRAVRMGGASAWVVVAVFILHPVNAEAVAWIVQQKTLMSALLFFAALLAFVQFDHRRERRRAGLWYALSLVLFIGSLLAKSASLMLPLVLCGYLLASPRPAAVKRRHLLQTLPFFCLAAIGGGVGIWYHHQHAVYNETIRGDSAASRLLIAARAAWFYWGKALAPNDLSFIYERWPVGIHSWRDGAPLLALVAAGAWCWRHRRGAGAILGWSAAYFITVLIPCLGLADISFMKFSLVADHWQYLALIAPLAATGMLAERALDRAHGKRWLAAAAAAAVLVAVATLGQQRALLFRDEETLWRDALRRNPGAFIAHNNLGLMLTERGQFAEAATHFAAAAHLRPNDAEFPRLNQAEATMRQGDLAGALELYRQAVRDYPRSTLAHFGLAYALQSAHQTAAAADEYRTALALNPEHADSHQGLGLLFNDAGNYQAAAAELRQAVHLMPQQPEMWSNLGMILLRLGDSAGATAAMRQALALGPDSAEAHANMGFALLKAHEMPAAETELQEALRRQPDLAGAQQNLGFVLAARGDLAGSMQHYREAVKLAPQNPDLRLVLGILLTQAGRLAEAEHELRTAQQLAPNDKQVAEALAAIAKLH